MALHKNSRILCLYPNWGDIADFLLGNGQLRAAFFLLVFKLTHFKNHVHTLLQFSFSFFGERVLFFFSSYLADGRECFLQLGSFPLLLPCLRIILCVRLPLPRPYPHLLGEKVPGGRPLTGSKFCPLPLIYFVTCRSWSNYLALEGHSFCGVCNCIYSTFY